METQRSSGFPADVLVALTLPGMAIIASVIGFQRMWVLLVIAGLIELSVALSALRHSSSSVVAWLALTMGIMIIAAGIRCAFIL
jgi:uncharacterized membrane protein